jgi:predicted transposase YdaD
LKYYRDMENSLDLKYAKGIKEGLKKGKEEGLKKGKEEGLKKGKEEGLKKGKEEGLKEGLVITARNMKAKGFSVAEITELTGLTATEIEKL